MAGSHLKKFPSILLARYQWRLNREIKKHKVLIWTEFLLRRRTRAKFLIEFNQNQLISQINYIFLRVILLNSLKLQKTKFYCHFESLFCQPLAHFSLLFILSHFSRKTQQWKKSKNLIYWKSFFWTFYIIQSC
jgi:hypothetical protein